MSNELIVLVNPHAGSAARRSELENAFGEAGAKLRVSEVNGPQLQDKVRRVVNAGARVIGVAGGDGTISTAANALAGTDTALLPIPLGTMNHFSRRFGVPSVAAAVRAWQRSSAHGLHVGSVNDRIFINNASCGFYPHVVRHRERLERFLPRPVAMWLAGVGVLAKLPLLELDIMVNGASHRVRTPALWVGIGRNSLRLPVPGDGHTQGAVLEAVSGRASTRPAVLALGFRMFRHLKRGMELRDERLDVLRADHFTLHSRKPIDVALDGEPLTLRGPLRFAIRAHALRVLCLIAPAD